MLPIQAISWTTQQLRLATFIEFPDLEAKILLQKLLHADLSMLLISPVALHASQLELLQQWVKWRQSGMPIAKIIGMKNFFDYDFIVNQHVLDPRLDSEVMIQAFSEICPPESTKKFLELGVGSGALSITLLLLYPHILATAVDISSLALDIARENAIMHHVKDRLTLIESNWLENITDNADFDFIISNPPYLNHQEIQELDLETKYDPLLALDGGLDGMQAYADIMAQIAQKFPQKIKILFEIGPQNLLFLEKIAQQYNYTIQKIWLDNGGRNRIVFLF